MKQAGQPSAAVVGAGWAGLSAAVGLASVGYAVTVFEMAPVVGGRARTVNRGGQSDDNGQHILIGAYRSTLALMRQVGIEPEQVLERTPLALLASDGRGLRLPAGHTALAFARAVMAMRHWPLRNRLALLRRCAGWATKGFRCDPSMSVDELCAGLPKIVRDELLDPLCVAALNTGAPDASAQVFLRVIHDVLGGDRGSADLLLPRVPLGTLMPEAAARWLAANGARLRLRTRVQSLEPLAAGWTLDGQPVDTVILASTAAEAARLARPHAPAWAERARALRHQAILTTYVHCPGASLPHHPMARLDDGPAQFVFDHGWLTSRPGLFAFVASAVDPWLETGSASAEAAVLAQARGLLGRIGGHTTPTVAYSVCERRATFACTPMLQRPGARIAPGLWAAGDYVEGPYPATLEGAVSSGAAAARAAALTPREHDTA